MELPVNGNIHTVFLETPVASANAVNETEPVVQASVSKKLYTRRGEGLVYRQSFNPNKSILPAHFGVHRYAQECMSLGEYELYRDGLLSLEGIETNSTKAARVDFKFDLPNTGQVETWVKTCDILIQAFVMKHGVTDKNNQTTTTHTGTRHKNAKARSGTLEVVNYNKSIQQESNGAEYRLELHTLDTQGRTEEQTLQAWAKELHSLAAYYDEALNAYNMALVQDWQTATHGTKEPLRLNQFLHLNGRRIFARKQLKGLYKILGGKSDVQAVKAAENYCRRYKHQYVTYMEYAEFINHLCDCLDKYGAEKPLICEGFFAP